MKYHLNLYKPKKTISRANIERDPWARTLLFLLSKNDFYSFIKLIKNKLTETPSLKIVIFFLL
jgi:hypothetical protein